MFRGEHSGARRLHGRDVVRTRRADSYRQSEFPLQLIGQLARNGVADPRALFESPYSEMAPSGPDVLLGEDRAVRLISTLRAIEGHARVG